jgi:hypothetical protein
MFHVKFVHYMLKKRQLATRPLMCLRLFIRVLHQDELSMNEEAFEKLIEDFQRTCHHIMR